MVLFSGHLLDVALFSVVVPPIGLLEVIIVIIFDKTAAYLENNHTETLTKLCRKLLPNENSHISIKIMFSSM